MRQSKCSCAGVNRAPAIIASLVIAGLALAGGTE